MPAQMIAKRAHSSPLLGDLPDYKKDPFAFWLSLEKIAPVVRIRFGPAIRYVVNDPDIAQHILQKNYFNYTKDQRLKKILEEGTGPVLATSDGEDWRWRRKLVQPTFKPKAIAPFSGDIIKHTARMMDVWKAGEIIDFADAMKMLTMNIIGETMFSVDFTKTSGELHHAYADFGQGLVRRATQIIRPPLWMPTKGNVAFRKSIVTMKTFLWQVLAERRRDPIPNTDLLNMLLTHRLEDDGQRFSEQQLLHEMSAIVFAGHETTATALSWVFALLAQHPETYKMLMTEIDQVLGTRNPTPDDIKNMSFLEQVIEETLRLYPPLYINSRQAIKDDNFGKQVLAENSRVLINILGINRNSDHWHKPDVFMPERFSPEKKQKRHSFAHIPFLKGPRMCVGAPLAMMELQLIVPMILQRFSLSLGKPGPVLAETGVVLQPRGGLFLKVSKRA